jgi:hypothetical protein
MGYGCPSLICKDWEVTAGAHERRPGGGVQSTNSHQDSGIAKLNTTAVKNVPSLWTRNPDIIIFCFLSARKAPARKASAPKRGSRRLSMLKPSC